MRINILIIILSLTSTLQSVWLFQLSERVRRLERFMRRY